MDAPRRSHFPQVPIRHRHRAGNTEHLRVKSPLHRASPRRRCIRAGAELRGPRKHLPKTEARLLGSHPSLDRANEVGKPDRRFGQAALARDVVHACFPLLECGPNFPRCAEVQSQGSQQALDHRRRPPGRQARKALRNAMHERRDLREVRARRSRHIQTSPVPRPSPRMRAKVLCTLVRSTIAKMMGMSWRVSA